MVDLTIFENLAYIMAKHADNSLPDTGRRMAGQLFNGYPSDLRGAAGDFAASWGMKL